MGICKLCTGSHKSSKKVDFRYIFNLKIKAALKKNKVLARHASLIELNSRTEFHVDCLYWALGLEPKDFSDLLYIRSTLLDDTPKCPVCSNPAKEQPVSVRVSANEDLKKFVSNYYCLGCFISKFGNQVISDEWDDILSQIYQES